MTSSLVYFSFPYTLYQHVGVAITNISISELHFTSTNPYASLLASYLDVHSAPFDFAFTGLTITYIHSDTVFLTGKFFTNFENIQLLDSRISYFLKSPGTNGH